MGGPGSGRRKGGSSKKGLTGKQKIFNEIKSGKVKTKNRTLSHTKNFQKSTVFRDMMRGTYK